MNLEDLSKMRKCWPAGSAKIIGAPRPSKCRDFGRPEPVRPWYIILRDAINTQMHRAEDRAEGIATLKVIALLLAVLIGGACMIPWAMERQVAIEIEREVGR